MTVRPERFGQDSPWLHRLAFKRSLPHPPGRFVPSTEFLDLVSNPVPKLSSAIQGVLGRNETDFF